MMMALRLTLLGGFEARFPAGGTIRLPTKKGQALLAYLGLQPGHAHQRDELASLLWGESNDERARDCFRHALLAVRKALDGATRDALHVDGRTLALNSAVVDVDVATFQERVAAGTPLSLEQAAELYRGDLLLGFTVSAPPFEEWLVAERERLREKALEARARLLAHQMTTGGTEQAIQTAIRLLALDPLQEAVHRTLMQLYARQGRRGAALKHYQLCVAILRRELGTEPEPETTRLYHELLRRPNETVRASSETRPSGSDAEAAEPRELPADTMRGHGFLPTVTEEAVVDERGNGIPVLRCSQCRRLIEPEESIVAVVVDTPAKAQDPGDPVVRLQRAVRRWHLLCAPRAMQRYAAAVYGLVEKRILAVVALAAITAFLAINIPNNDIDSIDDLMHAEIIERFT